MGTAGCSFGLGMAKYRQAWPAGAGPALVRYGVDAASRTGSPGRPVGHLIATALGGELIPPATCSGALAKNIV
jgi:hypothetical protein